MNQRKTIMEIHKTENYTQQSFQNALKTILQEMCSL